jgi:hypothetical protein
MHEDLHIFRDDIRCQSCVPEVKWISIQGPAHFSCFNDRIGQIGMHGRHGLVICCGRPSCAPWETQSILHFAILFSTSSWIVDTQPLLTFLEGLAVDSVSQEV